jgi:hypothetical protein
MKPAEVLAKIDLLNAAISPNDEEKAAVHALALLGGLALNIAHLAHGRPIPTPAPENPS